jgi:hypothetical protein
MSSASIQQQEVHAAGKKQQQQTGLGAGKKIKSIMNKPLAAKCTSSSSNHMTLRNETEDTCDDDFFSTTHIQKSSDSKISK